MAITDLQAVNFSNVQLRPAADKMTRAFYKADEARDQWNALTGTNAQKLALMEPMLRSAANQLRWTYRFCEDARLLWDALNIQAVIPNDGNETLYDNADQSAADPNRQALTGQDLRRINWRLEEFTNWLKYTPLVSNPVFVQDSNLTTEILGYAAIEDVLKLTANGFLSPTGTHANNLITRCGELVTEWETANPSKFTHILKAAVNPQAI